MTLFFGLLFCIFLAFIWIEYFRRIDIFENEKRWMLVIVFFLGILSTFFTDVVHAYFIDPFGFYLNGHWPNDILYCLFGIGLVEETAKFLPIILLMIFFRKHLNETIDYIVFAAISAVGFACFENVLYFLEHGFKVIAIRSVTALPSHIFDSSIFIYGIVQYRFRGGYKKVSIIILFMFLGILAHGTYDFLLLGMVPLGYIGMLIFYLFLISVFVTILGNSLNNSQHFSPNKFIDSKKITEFMLKSYFGLWLISTLFFVINAESGTDVVGFLSNIIWKDLFLVLVLIFRISRFKIIPGRWSPIRPELPFSLEFRPVFTGPPTTRNLSNFILPAFMRVKIKGESYNETYLNYFFDKDIIVQPISRNKSFLKKRYNGVLDLKLFLKNDEVFYVLIVFTESGTEYFYIKSKPSGRQRFGKHPIVALLKGPPLAELNEHYSLSDFKFLEWVVLKLK